MSKNNHHLSGGPAYPTVYRNDGDMNVTAPDGQLVPPQGDVHMMGATLRDIFAVRALPVAMAQYEYVNSENPEIQELVADNAYTMADAMVARSRIYGRPPAPEQATTSSEFDPQEMLRKIAAETFGTMNAGAVDAAFKEAVITGTGHYAVKMDDDGNIIGLQKLTDDEVPEQVRQAAAAAEAAHEKFMASQSGDQASNPGAAPAEDGPQPCEHCGEVHPELEEGDPVRTLMTLAKILEGIRKQREANAERQAQEKAAPATIPDDMLEIVRAVAYESLADYNGWRTCMHCQAKALGRQEPTHSADCTVPKAKAMLKAAGK